MKETRYQIEDKHQQQDMNFFRGNYAGNKPTDKETYFFSSRAKDDNVKAKPKLLTGRLPAAFNVQGEISESEAEIAKKVLPVNSIDQREIYSTEGNSNQKRSKFYQKQKIDQFNSDNSDSEKTIFPKQNSTNSTRPKTESDNENEKIIFQKPIYLRGSSSNSQKKKSIANNITLDPPPLDNVIEIKSDKAQNHSRDINMSKTQKFLPKMSLEKIDYKAQSKNRMIKDIKSKQFALEDGFTYYSNSILKHYFHVPLLQLYFLKEFTYESTIIDQIKQWQQWNCTHTNFLKIHQYFINNPEGCITVLFEYPFGYSINEIINSTGITSNYLLNKITRNCLRILSIHNKDNNSKDYGIFCLCDLFYNSNGEMKIIPNIALNEHIDLNSLCECKQFLNKLSKTFKVNITQFFSLGYILLRCLTGNIQLKVYEKLFQLPNLKLKCCLMHTILSIEENYFSIDDNVLLSHFLGLLPENCIHFICDLLSFNNTKPNYNNTWLNSIAKQRIALKMNELLKVAYEDNLNDYYIEQFIHKFNMVYMNLTTFMNINEVMDDFKTKKKEIEAICKLYDFNINTFIDRIKESIISNNLSIQIK